MTTKNRKLYMQQNSRRLQKLKFVLKTKKRKIKLILSLTLTIDYTSPENCITVCLPRIITFTQKNIVSSQ